MRRILLLGGASEIGLAIVAELLRTDESPTAVLLAGRPTSAHREQALAQVRRAGAVRVEWLDFDAQAVDEHQQVLDAAFRERVDIAIVAFGILGDRQTWRDHAATMRLVRTNYVGAVSVGVLLGQRLAAQGGGQLVALSSMAGERVRRTNLVYGSTKAGMDGFYLQLGVELADAGVRVLVVRPGVAVGRMTRGRRRKPLSTTPEQIARATVRALAAGRPKVRVPAAFNVVSVVFRNLPAAMANRLPF